MRVIAIMGCPGTGKTTLMGEIFSRLPALEPHYNDVKLVPFLSSKDGKLIVLGRYDGEGYAQGTDRMSMAAQPAVMEWIKTLPPETTILFEGDRLSTQSFLLFCEELCDDQNLYIYVLNTSDAEKDRRYKARNSNQSEQFLKGRETKYASIQTNFTLMPCIESKTNETIEDAHKIAEEIVRLC